ncbi:hypothetical protein TNCV_4297311 [Trichonephila clavipes]|nr:hypothetical protein TNCV_4297311 [Trichonephila clavipes]
MFSVVPDTMAQPVTVEKKGLPRSSSSEPLIFADEMFEIEEEKSKLSKRKLKKSGRMTVDGNRKSVKTQFLKPQATLYLCNVICVLKVIIHKLNEEQKNLRGNCHLSNELVL